MALADMAPQGSEGARAPRGRMSALLSLLAAAIDLSFLINWVAMAVVVGVSFGLIFDGEGGNGPFQLFNPLRRIAAGQRPGVDFQVFHGWGIPYLHYPLFWLFGGTIHASEMARHLVTSALFVGSTVAVFLAVTGGRRATLPLVVAAIILIDATGLLFLNKPGHALIGVRSTMPVLVFAVLLRPRRDLLHAALLGSCLGGGFLLGTEQGLAMIVAWAFVQAVDRLRGGSRAHRAGHGALTWAAAAASIAIPLLLAGGPRGAAQALRYCLAEVMGDQFWYFGVPPNPYVRSWTQFIDDRAFLYPVLAGTLLLAVCLRLLIRARDPDEERFARAASALMAYGLLSCGSYLGATIAHYVQPLERCILLVSLAGVYLFGQRVARESPSARRIGAVLRPCLPVVVLALILRGYPGGPAFDGLYHLKGLRAYTRMLADVARETDAGRLGPISAEYLQQATAAIDADRGSARGPFTLWSTYAGLLEGHYGLFHPDTDYLIHVLGPARRAAYLANFRQVRPDYVQTMRKCSMGTYLDWLQDESWMFHDDVLRNYAVLGTTNRSVLWKRKTGPWVPPPASAASLKPRPGRRRIELPVRPDCPAGTIAVVHVTYSVRNRWRHLPLFNRLPRYLIVPSRTRITNPISLPPFETEWTFPLVLEAGTRPRLTLDTASLLGGAGFRIKALSWRYIEPDGATRALVE